jgi:hypothetical protein
MRYQVHNMFSFLKQKLLINKDIQYLIFSKGSFTVLHTAKNRTF